MVITIHPASLCPQEKTNFYKFGFEFDHLFSPHIFSNYNKLDEK